jgi:hypothetical protein
VSGSCGGAPVTDMDTRAKTNASAIGNPILQTQRTVRDHCCLTTEPTDGQHTLAACPKEANRQEG